MRRAYTVALVSATGSLALLASEGAVSQVRSPGVGDTAPQLNVAEVVSGPSDVDFSWSALSGNVVIIDFWATWCGPCRASARHLNDLADSFVGSPVRFIAISDEDPITVKRFLELHPIRGWDVVDDKRQTFRGYQVNEIPVVAMVDQQGKIAALTHPQNLTKEAIRNVLNHRPAGILSQLDQQSRTAEPALELIVWKGVNSDGLVVGGSWNRADGRFSAATTGAFDFRRVLGFVYDIPPSRVLGTESIDTVWSVELQVPNQSRDLARSLLREALEATVGFRAERNQEEVTVYELRPRQGVEDGTERGAAQPSSGRVDIGRNYLHNFSVDGDMLAKTLERLLGVIIVNATESQKGFSLKVQIDDTKLDSEVEQLLPGIRDALAEQAGLDLVRVTRTMDVLQVRTTRLDP